LTKVPEPVDEIVCWFELQPVPSESIVATPGIGGEAVASPSVSWAPPEIDRSVHP